MLIDTIAFIVAILLALPLVVLGIECWLSLLPLSRQHLREKPATPFRIAVVIPAHDEADRIAHTVKCVKEQVPDDTQVIVIADNCSDATATNAIAAGAVAWQRDEPERRGKGFALNFAWQHLADSPPDVVVCIDADCEPGTNCIATIAGLAYERRRPVQAAYTMYASSGTSGLAHVSALAVYVKNVVRPRGLQWLRLPCLLTGSGMAFPWESLAAVRHQDAHIVEDMRACTDFAIAGFAPLPCMEVGVTSPLPTGRSGFMSQRTRWEYGHVQTILSEMPRLFARFLVTGKVSLLALALELAVPPLSLLIGISAVSALIFAGVGFATMNWWPLVCLASAMAIAASGIGVAWFHSGRGNLPGRMIIAEIPRYIAAKAPMYFRFLSRPQTDWVRTERAKPLAVSPDGIPSSQARSLASIETVKRASTEE